jgi:dienelactone hydrolase
MGFYVLLAANLGLAPSAAAEYPAVFGRTFEATDSLDIGPEASDDARRCLHDLSWPAATFSVTCHRPEQWHYDCLVRYPSPTPSGSPINDSVAIEWHMARDANGDPVTAPAVIVVHESGRRMTVGRTFAKLLAAAGLHALMVQLPGYGDRADENVDPEADFDRQIMQAVADVRRARDVASCLPGIDDRLIAVQGTSLGGFVASTSAGLDQGFGAIFIMLSGGNLYDVIQNGQRDAADLRNRLAARGLTDDRLREALYRVEPVRLAHRLGNDRTWLFSGRTDTVVPLENAKALAAAANLDETHHIILDADHYSGAIQIPTMVLRIRDEIQRKMERMPPRDGSQKAEK